MQDYSINRRDKWIPWYFVAFFVGFITVDAVLVMIAVRSHTGVITNHAYEKGLKYNQTIAASEAQATKGWRGNIVLQTSDDAPFLTFTLADKSGQALQVESAHATIIRPTQDGMDQTISLIKRKDGSYGAPLVLPQRGAWDVRVYARVQGADFQQSRRIVVK